MADQDQEEAHLTSDIERMLPSAFNTVTTGDAHSECWTGSMIPFLFSQPLSMAHINVNRLINKMDEIKNVIKTCQFKILAISETRLADEISYGEINIPVFRVFR